MWAKIEPQFPNLARMARDILAVAGAGVGVERTFSTARNQSDYNRQYSPDTFSAIMLARHRQRGNHLEIAIAEDSIGLLNGQVCIEAENGMTGELAIEEYRERMEDAREIMNVDGISDDEGDGYRPFSELRRQRKEKGKVVAGSLTPQASRNARGRAGNTAEDGIEIDSEVELSEYDGTDEDELA